MIRTEFTNIHLAGLACCMPTYEESLEKFHSIFGKESVDKFSQTTGVLSRRLAKKQQTTSDLAFVAARELMRKKNVDPKTIGALVFVTQTPDYRLPATAYVLQARLGISEECLCFDVNLGCSGFLYGLNIVSSLLNNSNISRALLLFGDTPSKFTAPLDKSACMLSGDAAGAALLEKTPAAAPMHMTFRSMGDCYKAIAIYAGAYRNLDASDESRLWEDGCERSAYDLNMNGADVFSNMVFKAPKLVLEYLDTYGKTIDDYDVLLLHQANAYIMRQIAKRIKCPMDKVPITIDRYGNTSSASIPITIVDTYADSKQTGCKNVLMCGLGVGLSLGVVDMQIDTTNVLPMIFSDEYFEDGMAL